MSEEIVLEITPQEQINNLVEEIQTRIDHLERYSRMWGGPETIEFTMLTLVEFRSYLLRPKAMKKNPYEVRDAWAAFTRVVNGEETNTYLHVILKHENKLDLLPSLIGDAARWILQKYPAERKNDDE